MFLSSISDTRQKVHFQKTHRICFLYSFLLFAASELVDRKGTGRYHWASKITITVFSKASPLVRPLFWYSFLHLSFTLSLSLSKKLFKIYPDYWILCLADDDGIPQFSGIIDFDSPPLSSRYSSLSLSSLFSHKFFWNVLE